ncbi:MAG: FecR family protein [Pseudomonadota bacterium]|nr:FecR family protein [Pseudomonadota bacterium]
MTGPNFRRTLLALAAATSILGARWAQAQSSPAQVGIAAAVVGEVKLSNAQTPKAKAVALRQRIALADLIQTGKNGRLQVLLLDHSTFTIGANAVLRIDRFVYDPARGRTSGATVVRGAFRFMSGQSNRGNSAAISSPVATIGIRGTIVEGTVGEGARDIAKRESKPVRDADADKKNATLVVLRGPGPHTDPGAEVGSASVTSGGVTVELTEPMQAAFVPRAGAAPIGPFRISPQGLTALHDQVFPQPDSGGGLGRSLLGGVLGALPGIINGGGGGSTPSSPNDPPGRPPGKP